jgi:hypothetical protein
MFASISGAPDPSNEEQFDFRLQAGSPCIDTGGFLTTITSTSGSGTSFVVDDAGYFMDGWGVVAPDVLQLEGQAQAASVVGVDYVTNTITVDTSLTWTQGQGVGLQYEGAAPDLGAYEFAPPTESCGSLGGGCCASGQACSGGQFETPSTAPTCAASEGAVRTRAPAVVVVAAARPVATAPTQTRRGDVPVRRSARALGSPTRACFGSWALRCSCVPVLGARLPSAWAGLPTSSRRAASRCE